MASSRTSATSATRGRRARRRRRTSTHSRSTTSGRRHRACFDRDVTGELTATTVEIPGADGDLIEAYLARPEAEDRRGGVVVIHHMPGYDRGTKEIVRRFAELGYDAICPNLYWREAPGAAPDDPAATARAQGGVPDDRLLGHGRGAATALRGPAPPNGAA